MRHSRGTRRQTLDRKPVSYLWKVTDELVGLAIQDFLSKEAGAVEVAESKERKAHVHWFA